jgi:hypothetical protein
VCVCVYNLLLVLRRLASLSLSLYADAFVWTCESSRADLMAGGTGYDGQGQSVPSSMGAGSARRGPRVFGQETDKTRGVDDQGLLQVCDTTGGVPLSTHRDRQGGRAIVPLWMRLCV